MASFIVRTYAQNGGKVSGRVNRVETSVKDIGATVSLLQANDSSVVRSLVPNKDGLFVFENIPFGKYLVVATSAEQRKTYSGIFEVRPDKQSIDLPSIHLTPESKSLAGVTVIAKRPLIEHKIDRMVVNVEASITNAGATALDVLEKSPGIIVDNDGNISLKGKKGVLVMIDGRPTQLGGADLANLLRNMSSAQMDKIEIMTNPPARYDASGNAGIINIITKRNKIKGHSGSASLNYSQGRYPKTNEGFNFSYWGGKINLFTNFHHNYRKDFGTLTIQRNLRNNETKELENLFDQRADRIWEASSYSARTGLDYFVNKKTTLGLAFNGFSNLSIFNNKNRTNILTPSKEMESITRATVNNTSQWKNFSANMYFRKVFDSSGRELTADVDYATYGSTNDLLMSNAYYDAVGNYSGNADSLQGSLPQNIEIYSGRIDYIHPVKKGLRLETGIKSSIVRTDNNAGYDSIQNGILVHDLYRSNHFIYEENINAAYINLSKTLSKKVNVQFGLRLENTNAKGNQLTTGEKFDRHYAQLFPTAYFQYKANARNNFGLNFGRRVNRPNYQSLNPFIRFIDKYTYNQGNPDLKPQLSNNFELSHTYNNILTTTLNYSETKDIIQAVIEQKGQEAYERQANIASLRQFGVAVSMNNPITKWWTNNIYVHIYNNSFKGIVNNTSVSFSATRFSLNGTQQFKMLKTLTGEISGMYRSPGIEGVIKVQSMGMLSAGLSQQILKKKGTLRLTVRDIFYTQRTSATIRYGNVDAAFQQERDSRVVNIGFSYRFSKGKANSQRKRTNGSTGEEQNRVGVE